MIDLDPYGSASIFLDGAVQVGASSSLGISDDCQTLTEVCCTISRHRALPTADFSASRAPTWPCSRARTPRCASRATERSPTSPTTCTRWRFAWVRRTRIKCFFQD